MSSALAGPDELLLGARVRGAVGGDPAWDSPPLEFGELEKEALG